MIDTLVLMVAYAAGVFGGGAFVEWALSQILSQDDQHAIEQFRAGGLTDGGKIIGWLERFLVMTFFFSGSHAAIGLVLAAKGVIRYGEIKDARNQKVAEYVLIGTMLSLAWALFVCVTTNQLLG